jgi:hypothetical protein
VAHLASLTVDIHVPALVIFIITLLGCPCGPSGFPAKSLRIGNSLLEVKCSEREADCSLPSSAQMNVWSLTSLPIRVNSVMLSAQVTVYLPHQVLLTGLIGILGRTFLFSSVSL